MADHDQDTAPKGIPAVLTTDPKLYETGAVADLLEHMIKEIDKLKHAVDFKDPRDAALFNTAMVTVRMHLRAAAGTATRDSRARELAAELAAMQAKVAKLKAELGEDAGAELK